MSSAFVLVSDVNFKSSITGARHDALVPDINFKSSFAGARHEALVPDIKLKHHKLRALSLLLQRGQT